MQGKKVLIIEDDGFIRKSIETTFLRAGAIIRSVPDGRTALREFYQFHPDLVTLDLMMPHTDGWETCRQMRNLADTPIIMLTALKDESAEIRALDMGAIDFITKPFSPKVLIARAKAALRQTTSSVTQVGSCYKDDELSVDFEKRRVHLLGQPISLTKTEFELLAYLIRHKGKVLKYEQILDKVWGAGYSSNIDYVHVYISKLRKKIETDPKQSAYLSSERGVGYRFEGKD